MKILNFGSLNIDKTYQVEHFVQPKETVQALAYEEFCGGKGLNQSVALALAGAEVYHAGAVGADGSALLQLLQDSGVRTAYIRQMEDIKSGHAVIQVDKSGQNCILIYGGANQAVEEADIDAVLEHFAPGDLLLLQNETSCIAYAMKQAKAHGMKLALNPSPITEALQSCGLELADYLLLNEVEGKALAGIDTEEPEALIAALQKKFPKAVLVLTLGEKGAYYVEQECRIFQGIYPVKAVDTTAAGDTFCGYFIAGLAEGLPAEQVMKRAAAASALAVSRRGAAPSIPGRLEVERFLKQQEKPE